MSNYIFLFDLDATITRQEIFPTIAKETGIYNEIQNSNLGQNSINEQIPFKHLFLEQINLLKNIPVSVIQEMIYNIELNTKLVQFIQDNKTRSYIVTGCLDVWIEKLIHKLGMEKNLFCSKAILGGGGIYRMFLALLIKMPLSAK